MAQPWFDITTFANGAVADGFTDWSAIIQSAVNFIVSLPTTKGLLDAFPPVTGTETRRRVSGTLYFPTGKYRLATPILILRSMGMGYLPCSISFQGDANLGTYFLPDYVDRPAIIIQGGQGVQLRKLLIRGKNNWTSRFPSSLAASHYEDTNYVVNNCREVSQSPYAGICIDPFYSAEQADPRVLYPGLESYYRTPLSSGGVLIEDCAIEGFVAGIALSPAGVIGSAARERNDIALTIRNSHISSTESGLALGASTQRNVTLFSVGFIGARYGINCIDYGGLVQPGDCPSIFGGNVKGVKYIFHTGASDQAATISGLSAENCLSLGEFASAARVGRAPDGLMFKSCRFVFASPHLEGKPAMNAHLFNSARVLFSGCVFDTEASDGEPITFYNEGMLTFVDCHLGGARPDMGPSFWVTGSADHVTYERCRTVDLLTPDEAPVETQLGTFQRVPNFDARPYVRAQALPGTFYSPTDADTPSDLRWVSGALPLILLGTLFVNVIGDGTALIYLKPATKPSGLFSPGDLILCDEPIFSARPGGLDAPMVFGKVVDLIWQDQFSWQQVRLKYVPQALKSSHYPIYISYFQRLHPPTVGTLSLGSNTVQSVQAPGALDRAWSRGEKIWGRGIPPGTYITRVGPGTLTLSQEALMDVKDTELFDAPLFDVTLESI